MVGTITCATSPNIRLAFCQLSLFRQVIVPSSDGRYCKSVSLSFCGYFAISWCWRDWWRLGNSLNFICISVFSVVCFWCVVQWSWTFAIVIFERLFQMSCIKWLNTNANYTELSLNTLTPAAIVCTFLGSTLVIVELTLGGSKSKIIIKQSRWNLESTLKRYWEEILCD